MKKLKGCLDVFFVKNFVFYKLFMGHHKTLCRSSIKPFLKGFRHNFSVLNLELSLLYFRRALKFLLELLLSNKKILFIGAPLGFEKEFRNLCLSHKHYILEEDISGFFTNYTNIFHSKYSFSEKPSLIFIFSLPLNALSQKEFLQLDIPVMGFVSKEDDIFLGLDYVLPGNIYNIKGSVFAYNFFNSLFNFQSHLTRFK